MMLNLMNVPHELNLAKNYWELKPSVMYAAYHHRPCTHVHALSVCVQIGRVHKSEECWNVLRNGTPYYLTRFLIQHLLGLHRDGVFPAVSISHLLLPAYIRICQQVNILLGCGGVCSSVLPAI